MEELLPPQDAMDTTQPDPISPTAITDNPGHPIILTDPTAAALAEPADPNPPSIIGDDGPGENEPYKGMLWIKGKFEEYRLQTDERMGALRTELDRRGAIIENLNGELTQARDKITDLSTKLEKNMSLLMNIHKELDKSLVTEQTSLTNQTAPINQTPVADQPPTTPEAAHGGSGDQAGNV